MTPWDMIHAERAALADDLGGLGDAEWRAQSLCGRWTIEDVVAHLTAAASIGRFRWIRSVLGARFDVDVHNQRRMAEQLGTDPERTLDRFRDVVGSSTAASGHTPAWLGEVVVHSHDIRRPLGIDYVLPVETVTEVARFYASRDFAVSSRTAMKGLRLEATDGPFAAGEGLLVRGPTLALVMGMAARATCCDDLEGNGVAVLRSRCLPGRSNIARDGRVGEDPPPDGRPPTAAPGS